MFIYQLEAHLRGQIPTEYDKHLFQPGLYITAGTFDYLVAISPAELAQEITSCSKKIVLSNSEMKNIEHRILTDVEAILSDAPPPGVMEEIKLLLWLNPSVFAQYLGRSVEKNDRNNNHIFHVDVIGGRRKYFWKSMDNPDPDKIQIRSPFERYQNLRKWFSDPDSRVVLCIGGGGTRMYAATALLKIIDILEVRSHLSEIWGSSGGSMIGMPYSLGIAPQWIDKIGYDFYNNHYPELNLKGLHFKTLWVIIKNLKHAITDIRPGIIEFKGIFYQAISKVLKHANSNIKKIPFFGISRCIGHKNYLALTEPENIRAYHSELLSPSNNMNAMVASAAIPFLFKPEAITLTSGKTHYWVDGFINEEIPLISPYLKWKLDRDNNPKETPKRLKIFYVDLGARTSEIALPSLLQLSRTLKKKVGQLTDIIDRELDSRIKKALSTLNEDPNVEVLGLKIKLDFLGFLDAQAIPLIIQRSRPFIAGQLDKIEINLANPVNPEENLWP